MNTTKISHRPLTRKPPTRFEVLDGEVLLGDDKLTRKEKVLDALQAFYSHAAMTGSRKLQLEALAALSACRGL